MANQLLSALNLIAVLSVSAALPLYRRSENIANHNSTSTSLVDDLLFSPPNCSQITELDYDQSNRTHIDFRIGLNQLKKYLKDVREELNKTIAIEDQESFVQCYPAPVNTDEPRKLMAVFGPTTTQAGHLATWHGVLLAYANYTSVLLEDEEMPDQAIEKLNIIFKMLKAVLTLFSEVIEPHHCATPFDVQRFYYMENDCTRGFRSQISLKLAANMVTHLQGVVTDTQEVREDWYSASGINDDLNNSLAKGLRLSWLKRHVSNEEC